MLIVRKFLRDIPAVLGVAIIAAVVLLALVGPMIVPRPGAVFDSNIL